MFEFKPAPVLGVQEVKEKINTAVIIDVRRDEELEYGMLPNAKHIEITELKKALQLEESKFRAKYGFNKPDQHKELIFYCHAGGRSAKAAKIAITLGYNAGNFMGSIKAWSKIDKNVRDY